MKITNIIEIPKFISSYISNNIDNIDYHLHSFCKLLLTKSIATFGSDNEIFKLEYEVPQEEYSIRYFINFYLEKSDIDCKGDCIYEIETNVTKSLSNEVFEVELKTDEDSDLGTIKVYIDSFTSDRLILKSI